MFNQEEPPYKKDLSAHLNKQIKNIIDYLPGKSTRTSIKNEMLRVDHAGEFGAIHIYRGQLSIFSKAFSQHRTYKAIKNMEQQERVHLEKFNQVLPQRRIRPTLLSPLWKRGGFLLGAVSALISEKAAMACTEAVETVIDKHYDKQISYFSKDNDELLSDLKKFQEDERCHKHEAQDFGASQAPFYSLSTSSIKMLCRAMIKIAHKL